MPYPGFGAALAEWTAGGFCFPGAGGGADGGQGVGVSGWGAAGSRALGSQARCRASASQDPRL